MSLTNANFTKQCMTLRCDSLHTSRASGTPRERRWSQLFNKGFIEQAFERVQPSVSVADQKRYDELRRKLRRDAGALKPKDERPIDAGTESDMGGGAMEESGRATPSLYAGAPGGGSGKKRKM